MLYVCINSGDDQATSDMNLVGILTSTYTEFNCVQQASINDRVSISMFAR